ILTNYKEHDPFNDLKAAISLDTIRDMQEKMKHIFVSDEMTEYVLSLGDASRNHEDIELGISPRGLLGLMRAAQARAFLASKDYITPEDVKVLTPYVFQHRLILTM